MKEPLLDRLRDAIKQTEGFDFGDGSNCHCDPSVGAVPCEVCAEHALLRDCHAAITILRERVRGNVAGDLALVVTEYEPRLSPTWNGMK